MNKIKTLQSWDGLQHLLALESPQRKKILLLAIGIGVVAYFIFITNFLLDNHHPRMPWIDPLWAVNRGNWTSPIFSHVFYNANIPVLIPLFCIAVLAFSGHVFSLIIFQRPSLLQAFGAAVIAAVFPFQLPIFYYSFSSHLFALAQLFAVSAIFFSRKLNLKSLALGSTLSFISIATYQPALSVLATVLIASALKEFIIPITHAGATLNVKTVWVKLAPRIIAVFTGTVFYALFTKLLTESKVTETKSLLQIIEQSPTVAKASFLHLWGTQPELLREVKVLLLFTVLAGAGWLTWRTLRLGWRATGLCLIALFFFVLSTKALYFVSTNNAYFIYRYNAALIYFYIFFILLLLQARFKIIGLYPAAFIFIFILLRFVEADLVRQHIQLRGEQHDLAMLNRILYRIESLDEISSDRKYKLVIWGGIPSFRYKLFAARNDSVNLPGAEHMDASFPLGWNTDSLMPLLGSHIKFDPISRTRSQSEAIAKNALLSGQHKPWPHMSSVFIVDDVITVYMRVTPDLRAAFTANAKKPPT